MDESRKTARLKVTRHTRFVAPDGTVVQTRLYDISSSGLSLLYDYQLQNGYQCAVAVSLPQYGKVGDAEVKALCKVVYAVFCSSNRKFRVGLQFLKFEAGGEATLKKFIEEKLG